MEPNWGSALSVGDLLVDGDATWVNLGKAGNSVGVPIGDVSRRTYFPSERGLWTFEYGINVARAHILQAARCARGSWKTYPERITEISCRKNGLAKTSKVPKGYIWGKITDYEFIVDGPAGLVDLKIEIKATIGKGVSVEEDAGEGDYADSDLFEPGVQEMIGAITGISTGDVGYSPPLDAPNDDGITFPLSKLDAVITEEVHGTAEAQVPGIMNAFRAQAAAAQEEQSSGVVVGGGNSGIEIQTSNNVTDSRKEAAKAAAQELSNVFAENPVWYELALKPMIGQAFENVYEPEDILVLTVVKGIDLEFSEV
jgi:hypothetical protein